MCDTRNFMHSSKKINVFPFSLFGFCYEVYLHFWPLPAKHFQQEHSLCHDSNICETAYPVSVHQKILLLGCFHLACAFIGINASGKTLVLKVISLALNNDGICIVRNRNGITAENLSYILNRNDIKKSDAYQSGFLEGTTPAYEAYMCLKKSLAASIN